MTIIGVSPYNKLKDLAVHYRFRPGEHLHVCELAARLRVSATPVRETLTKLCAEALVMSVQSRGFFAKTLAAEEMKALYELAFLILRSAIESNVTTFSPNGICKPGELIGEGNACAIPDTGDVRSQALFIEKTYERIALLSCNPVMVDTIRSFNDRTRYVRLIGLELESNSAGPANDSCALHAALEAHDAPRAVAALRSQLDKKLKRMSLVVSEGLARSRNTDAFESASAWAA